MDEAMTKYHVKKRLDIIFEAPMLRVITSTLDQLGVPGYSVLPVLEGRGRVNIWSSEGQVSDSASMLALLCILDATRAEDAIDAVLAVLRDRIGFVTMSDVLVVRPDHF